MENAKAVFLFAAGGLLFGTLVLLALVGTAALVAWYQVGPDGAAACLQAAFSQPEPPR